MEIGKGSFPASVGPCIVLSAFEWGSSGFNILYLNGICAQGLTRGCSCVPRVFRRGQAEPHGRFDEGYKAVIPRCNKFVLYLLPVLNPMSYDGL